MRSTIAYCSDQEFATEVVDLYVIQKLSAPKIAERKGCSSLTILNILRSQDVEIRGRGTYLCKVQPDIIEQIILEYEGGLSLSMIGKRHGVNPNTIYYHLKRNGVQTRSNKKLSQQDVQKIQEEYTKSPLKETVERLARDYWVTVNAVRYHVKKVGK